MAKRRSDDEVQRSDEVQSRNDAALRRMFAECPVPSRLLSLIDQLDDEDPPQCHGREAREQKS